MSGSWTNSLFSIVVFCAMAVPAGALGRSPKKKVLLVNDELLSLGRTYSLEDFFWTGSGDGPLPPPDNIGQNPIIKTTTILATVFLDASSTMSTENSDKGEDCLTECPINPPSGEIDPTKVGDGVDEASSDIPLPDPRYWLLTVLRTPAVPLPPSLSRSLARLYQKAFLRQQERHLGIVSTSSSIRKKHHSDTNHTDTNNSTSVSIEEINSTKTLFLNHNESLTNDEIVNHIGHTNNFNETSTESYELLPNYLNSTSNTRPKRSIKSIAEELNIILMRNYTFEGIKNLSNVLDVVKREVYSEIGQPTVEVFLYNLTRENASGVNDEIKIIYWVSVGGRPVPARTAAHDMHLLADSEVVAELGYPITTKAEPYLKTPEAFNGVITATNMRDTWLIIAGAILAAIILLSLVTLLACRLVNKRKSSAASRSFSSSKINIDTKGINLAKNVSGKDNIAYFHDEKDKRIITIDKKKTDERYVTHTGGYDRGKSKLQRISSAESSSSSSSSTDTSQMTASLRQRQRLFEKQMQNEYATVNKKNKSKHKKIRSKKVGIAGEVSMLEDSGSMSHSHANDFVLSSPSSHSTSSCDSVIIRRPQGVISPTSYLSMPSVKSFPRGNAVEPLSRVLEPLSVRHLDMDSDSPIQSSRRKINNEKRDSLNSEDKKMGKEQNTKERGPHDSNLVRLGSMDKDPGVIGPLVWDMHRQKFGHDSQLSDDVSSTGGKNISKMRQRFSELVDDAFSLFGSGNASPKSGIANTPTKIKDPVLPISNVAPDNRRHSAKEGIKPINKESDKQLDRPQTALPPRPPLPRQNLSPTLAWGSHDGASIHRSSSAGGVRRPVIDVAFVNSDGVLPPDDPAIPLIQAIKKELEKLPGTSDA